MATPDRPDLDHQEPSQPEHHFSTMCHYNVDLEELPDDMLLVFMKEFDVDTILTLIGASPVAYRLFEKKRVCICNVHLGHKYIMYEVPAPLVEALHLVHGLQVRDSNHWYREALFPWPTDKEGSSISLVEKQKKIEDFPGWKNVVAACYVKDDDANSKEKPEDSSEEHARDQKRHTRDAINQLLSTKTLAWMKIGIKLVDDMEFVTKKLGVSLGPIPRNPEQTPWNVYREPSLTPISHLQIWLHEFRCHMRDCVRKDLFSSFVLKAGLKSDLHKELVSIPYGALEQEGAPVKRELMACHKPPAEGSREDKVLAIAMAHPHDKIVYDKTLWESGFEILARLCRLTSSELFDLQGYRRVNSSLRPEEQSKSELVGNPKEKHGVTGGLAQLYSYLIPTKANRLGVITYLFPFRSRRQSHATRVSNKT